MAGEVSGDEGACADDREGEDIPDRGGAEGSLLQTEEGEQESHDFVAEEDVDQETDEDTDEDGREVTDHGLTDQLGRSVTKCF